MTDSADARSEILNRIRQARGSNVSKEVARARIDQPPSFTRPMLTGDLTDRLVEQMEAVLMTVARIQTSSEIVEAVRWYLDSEGIEGPVTVAPGLNNLDWPENYGVGAATGEEAASVTPCLGAVAETGSLALGSSDESPNTLAFLPETHIVVVNESQVVGHLEDLWAQVRDQDVLPRAVNLITGPSRTGDIEQTIEIGAHGPRKMHVLIVADS
ncbi:MAG: LUD domain-containing protein [Gammaproteobacteria bacterium]|nr:LUD domain-containing protein [Gammaproteobacteria bacterium]